MYCHCQEWDPSLAGLAVSGRSEAEVRRWLEEAAAQRLLLTTPSVLVGERLAVVCRPGYVINQSSSSVQCTDRGDWSRPLPACLKWQ